MERTSTFLHPLPSHSTHPAASHTVSEPSWPLSKPGLMWNIAHGSAAAFSGAAEDTQLKGAALDTPNPDCQPGLKSCNGRSERGIPCPSHAPEPRKEPDGFSSGICGAQLEITLTFHLLGPWGCPVWSQGTQHGLLVPSSSVLLALEMKNKLLFGKHLLSGEKLVHKLMAVHSLPGEMCLKAP